VLTIDSLTCERAERLLFKDLSFSLAAGDVLQVTGANGAGKSSLLKILAGLIPPQAGKLLWQGQDIEIDRADYLGSIAYLGHLDGVKLGLTINENLNYAADLRRKIIMPPEQAIAQLGLGAQANQLVAHLSAGQRRRVALAQLLMSGAKLWILDEPFTALDKQTAMLLETLISHHCEAGGLVVIATHQPTSLASQFLHIQARRTDGSH